jgi:hypothetical protein
VRTNRVADNANDDISIDEVKKISRASIQRALAGLCPSNKEEEKAPSIESYSEYSLAEVM